MELAVVHPPRRLGYTSRREISNGNRLETGLQTDSNDFVLTRLFQFEKIRRGAKVPTDDYCQ